MVSVDEDAVRQGTLFCKRRPQDPLILRGSNYIYSANLFYSWKWQRKLNSHRDSGLSRFKFEEYIDVVLGGFFLTSISFDNRSFPGMYVLTFSHPEFYRASFLK